MNKALKIIYFSMVFLLMATLFGLSLTWFLPGVLVLALAAAVSVIVIVTGKARTNRRSLSFVVLLLVVYLYSVLISNGDVIISLIANSFYFIVAYSVLILSPNDKMELLRFISRSTSFLLFISLLAWFAYLAGLPLPHSAEFVHEDDYHSYVNYYFFVTRPFDDLLLPRFMGMFKEPGHAASICVILLLSNIKVLNKNKFDIVVFAVSLALSFSLGGWVVMALALLMMSLFEGRHKILKLVGLVAVWGFLVVEFYGNDDSALYQYIFARLEYDDENGIAGNNRTSGYFDSKYEQFSKTSGVWFGINSKLDEGNDWTKGSAGWKVFIVHWGYIGFFLIQLLFLSYFLRYRCRYGLIFFLCYMILCYIRAYFINPYWFYIFLLAIPLIYDQSKSNVIKNLKQRKHENK